MLSRPSLFKAVSALAFVTAATAAPAVALPPPILTQTQSGCPGIVVSFQVTNATPNGTVALVFASTTGTFTIPGGPCAGTVLGLSNVNIQLVGTNTASAAGVTSFSGPAGINVCGGWLQAVDVTTCTVSNVAQIL